ncbi:MAG: glycosyltransferase family 2 protein [Candidatus Methanomethylicia archaeon]
MLVSIFIPIYRGSRILDKVLKRLVNQDVDKEIFVVIDKPSENSLHIIKEFEDRVYFIINMKRIGKVNALNEAVRRSRGEILLFLDGDVEIPEDPYFLRMIINEMEDADILDLRKEIVRSSFLSRMMYYEYIVMNIYSWLSSKFTGKTPAINGAAFAIRRNVFNSLNGFRRVISEDLDIAIRAFLKGYRFKYAEKVKVYNHVYLNWKLWIRQRKRWAIGWLLWFKEWCIDLAKTYLKYPKLLFPLIILILPTFIALLGLLVPNQLVHELLIAIILLFITKYSSIPPTILLMIPNIKFINESSILLLNLLSTSLLYFILSRKLKFKFKVYEFIAYSLLYLPVYIVIITICFIQIFILREKARLNWKV